MTNPVVIGKLLGLGDWLRHRAVAPRVEPVARLNGFAASIAIAEAM